MARRLAPPASTRHNIRLRRPPAALVAHDGGGVLIYVALILPVLMGFAALAVDVGGWYSERRLGQNIADAAAVSGALEVRRLRAADGTIDDDAVETGLTLAAGEAAELNGYETDSDQELEVNWPPQTGPFAGDPDYVEAVHTRPATVWFARVYRAGGFDIYSRAVATLADNGAGPGCIYGLSTVANPAISVRGAAQVDITGCATFSNAPFEQVGESCFQSDGIYAYGAASGRCITPEVPVILDAYFADPLAAVPEPVSTGCEHSATTVRPKDNLILQPGTYCGDLIIKGTAQFESGLYYIHGGSFIIESDAVAKGTAVTFYLDDAASDSAFQIKGGATVNLSAPASVSQTTSPYFVGMLFYQDRDVDSGVTHEFKGGSTMSLSGTIYTAGAEVQYAGGSVETVGDVMIVADTVDFAGETNFTIANDSSIRNNPTFDPPARLVE